MPQNDSTLPFRLGAKRLELLICAVLALLTLITFRSVLSNEFIKFDDRQYVTDNTHVTSGLTWRNVKWAFTTVYASNWHPLTWLSHMLDVQLFGLRAGGHHLTNLVLHVANTLVLFLVLTRMSRAIWSAAFVAALFGVHPLHVESVAWVAERKDVLSTLFFFLTLGAYALYVAETRVGQKDSPQEAPSDSADSSEAEKRRPQRLRWRRFAFYILSLLLFAMGLLSKAMLVTTPFVLLLLDWWPLKRMGTGKFDRPLWLGLVLEKIPFLCLTVLSCVVTFRAQAGSHSVTTGLPFGLRAENAIVSYVKYIGKSVWPADLAIFYPHPNTRYGLRELAAGCPSSEQWPTGLIAAVALLLVTISFLAVFGARRHPWFFTGWFWYVGTLVPVIGIVQIGMQGMADRYTYVPLVGLFLCLAWGTAELLQPRRFGKPLLWGSGLLAVACCATAAHQQALHWRTNGSVFEQALKATRHNAIAECNVGEEFAQAGKLDLAQEHFRSALKADPRNPLARLDLGMSLELQGKPEQALEQFEATVRLRPWSDTARRHLAGVLKSLGRRDEALVQYEEVLKLNPGDAIVHYEVGTILATQAKMNEALVHLSRAVQLKPDYVEALVGLGTLLASQGKFNEAQQPLQQATLLRPNNAELRLELGKTLLLAGKNAEATAEFAQVVRLDPELPDKLLQEGKSLATRGELSTALARCNTALWLQPESAGALSEVAWLLATHSVPRLRNGARALRLAQKAVDLTSGSELRSLAALDAAYAETGRFSEAINAVQKTHTLAVSAGDKEATQACETRLALYRNQQPFHQ